MISPADANKKLVVIESPYAGDTEKNTAYARACLMDSLQRGEAPLASHLLYTQVLLEELPTEREMGLLAGLSWIKMASALVVYNDNGLSYGMTLGIAIANHYGIPIIYRSLVHPGQHVELTITDNIKLGESS